MGLWHVRLGGLLKHKLNPASGQIQFTKTAPPFINTDGNGITAILTGYLRTEYLIDQIEALRNQTIPPEEIWVWTNQASGALIDASQLADRVIVSNTNWSFWGRFALANLVRTEYVAFFDDDILPQPKWFENCMNTIANGYDGILGGSGVILPMEGGYSSKNKAGWNGAHLNEVAEVDLVGHAWFLRKSTVNFMWREEPSTWENGEDIHFSYMALKHGGIKTWVPPHPDHDLSLWSCRPDFGKIVGRKKCATHRGKDHKQTRSEIVNRFRDDGWKIVEQRNPDTAKNRARVEAKDFATDLKKFNRKLFDKEHFSLVRFGDGEMMVINGEQIDLSKKCNGEHRYTPENSTDEKFRKILEASLVYQNENYYVGLPCRCCVGDTHCDQLRHQSGQKEAQLTWANLYVNSNYPTFTRETIEGFKINTVNVICHQSANTDSLPFDVVKDFRVGANAWVNDYDQTLEQINHYIEGNKIKDQVFIFCAGVLSNMLIYQLTRMHPKNTYIDTGSVFDDIMGLGKTRKYLKGSRKRLKKVCVW